MTRSAQYWLDALQGLGIEEPVRIMNVCGGHERSISIAGLRTAIPDKIELVRTVRDDITTLVTG